MKKPDIKRAIAVLRRRHREVALTVAVAAGLGCITRGIALVSEPAAWIFGGLGLIVVAYLCLAEA